MATAATAKPAGAPMDTSAASALKTVMEDTKAALAAEAKTKELEATARGETRGVQSRWMQPAQLEPQDRAVLEALHRIVGSRSMQEHIKVFNQNVAPDIAWDAPVVLMRNRHAMQDMVYVAKRIAYIELEPFYVKKEVVNGSRQKLHIEAMVHVKPVRPFWPITWLAPEDIPIRATIVVGVVKGADAPNPWGYIDSLYGRWHNWPSFPKLFRYMTALYMGYLLKWTEPLWTKALPLIGDTSLQGQEGAGAAAPSTQPVA